MSLNALRCTDTKKKHQPTPSPIHATHINIALIGWLALIAALLLLFLLLLVLLVLLLVLFLGGLAETRRVAGVTVFARLEGCRPVLEVPLGVFLSVQHPHSSESAVQVPLLLPLGVDDFDRGVDLGVREWSW